jgi:FkbM family methyltransferase
MNNQNELTKKIKQKSELIFAKIIDPLTNNEIKFSLKNDTTIFRAKTMFSKEPETINWIRGFAEGSVFYDIGANVGVYSLFGAINSKAKVYSFEPDSNNFQVLMENILINKLNDLILAYPIGISDKTELTKLNLSIFDVGASHHTVGESLLDHNSLKKINNNISQGIFSTPLDDLCGIWGLPEPNYIKIDVDGIENKIIKKSEKILKSNSLNSVLIEINANREEDKEILDIMKFHGFNYDINQITKSTRQTGRHKGYAEYIFKR